MKKETFCCNKNSFTFKHVVCATGVNLRFNGDFLVLVVNNHKLPEMMKELKGSAFFYPYNFSILHLNSTQSAFKIVLLIIKWQNPNWED